MKATTMVALALIALGAIALGTIANADDGDDAADSDDSALVACATCHAPSSDVPVLSILHTPHGRIDCAGCHGTSAAHGNAPIDNSPSISFGPRKPSTPTGQDATCLDCHTGGTHTLWVGSVHQDEDISCTGCHAIHTRQDQALDRVAQSQICFECHTDIRATVRLSSRHPILEGRTACVDCHNPHGSTTEAALVEPTLNDTCYTCHAEKRGPFLFEHPPAAEDCSLCHRPHGSVNDRLLTTRGPFLCQQCHSAAFHPSQLRDGEGLPAANASPFLLGRNCLNCHAQVHGSNHPSGARLTR
jgi:DmsE family decaheme c-type cytochrome